MLTINDFYRGDTKEYTITVTDSAGTPQNIGAWELFITFKVSKTDDDVDAALQVQYSVPTGTPATEGITTLTVTAAQTAELAVGSYYYDIQRVISTSDVETIAYGKVKVLQDITIDIA